MRRWAGGAPRAAKHSIGLNVTGILKVPSTPGFIPSVRVHACGLSLHRESQLGRVCTAWGSRSGRFTGNGVGLGLALHVVRRVATWDQSPRTQGPRVAPRWALSLLVWMCLPRTVNSATNTPVCSWREVVEDRVWGSERW